MFHKQNFEYQEILTNLSLYYIYHSLNYLYLEQLQQLPWHRLFESENVNKVNMIIVISCFFYLLYDSKYSGITRGGVLNGELYAQRLHMLLYLYLFTDCFMKISLQSLE